MHLEKTHPDLAAELEEYMDASREAMETILHCHSEIPAVIDKLIGREYPM